MATNHIRRTVKLTDRLADNTKDSMPKENSKSRTSAKLKRRKPVQCSAMVRGRRWVIDEMIEMEDAHIIELARDYGYGGDDPKRAAVTLRGWLYRVREWKPSNDGGER